MVDDIVDDTVKTPVVEPAVDSAPPIEAALVAIVPPVIGSLVHVTLEDGTEAAARVLEVSADGTARVLITDTGARFEMDVAPGAVR